MEQFLNLHLLFWIYDREFWKFDISYFKEYKKILELILVINTWRFLPWMPFFNCLSRIEHDQLMLTTGPPVSYILEFRTPDRNLVWNRPRLSQFDYELPNAFFWEVHILALYIYIYIYIYIYVCVYSIGKVWATSSPEISVWYYTVLSTMVSHRMRQGLRTAFLPENWFYEIKS